MNQILVIWNAFCNFFAWYIFIPALIIWFIYTFVSMLAPQKNDTNN